jgi:hypothetical protein
MSTQFSFNLNLGYMKSQKIRNLGKSSPKEMKNIYLHSLHGIGACTHVTNASLE